MSLLNMCRCRCGSSGFLKTLNKTVASRYARRESNDASDRGNDGNPKTTKRTAKSKLYDVSHDQDQVNAAKKKLNSLKGQNLVDKEDGNNVEVPVAKSKPYRRKKDSNSRKELFDKKLVASATEVANELGGDTEKTKSEIIDALGTLGVFKESTKKQKNMSGNSKLGHPKEQEKASQKVQNFLQDIKPEEISTEKEVEHFPEKHEEIQIFDPSNLQGETNEVHLKVWDELVSAELNFLVKSPPRNYYQQMIMWTEEGKLWHFPIDNDQGMEEEEKVSFTKHVFLDEHLEPWCPRGGPLRHFMELVLIGLSKNPYLSVQDKEEHIYWFRDYFEKKKNLLLEIGAMTQKNLKSANQTGQENT